MRVNIKFNVKKIPVIIQPTSEVDEGLMEEIIEEMKKLKTFKITMAMKRLQIGDEGYNPERRQHHAPTILRKICTTTAETQIKTLGITTLDLYDLGLNYVFGEAQFNGRCAIISIHRLRPEYYGGEEDKRLLLERINKEAAHELGHTLGLRHCPNIRCVMHFSNSIYDTDIKDYRYCERCRAKLEKIISRE